MDKTLIPEELRGNAITITVSGAINGYCFLVPYSGKLKRYTAKKVVGMFVPQTRNGKEKIVSVSVVEEDRIIYVSSDTLKVYGQGFNTPEGITLRKTLFN